MQLSPRDPRDALYQLKCYSTVVRVTQTVRLLAWETLSNSATFYSVTCIVLYTHRSAIAQLAWDEVAVISKLLCQCTVNRVHVNWTVTVIIRFRLALGLNIDDTAYCSASVPSWTRTTVAEGHKFSAVKRLRRKLLDRS